MRKNGTSLRLTTKGHLALIKTDEYGYGKNKIAFGFIGVYLRSSQLNGFEILTMDKTFKKKEA
jgi:hypothetical protein